MRRALQKFALLFAFAFTLASCGDAPAPRLRPLAEDAVLLAFGDSLTRGFGAQAGGDYPSLLAARIGRRVVNAGVNGETTPSGRARLPGVLDAHKPALLILCHGGNDLLQRRNRARTEENLRAMLRAARTRGVDVLLIGVPAPPPVGRTLRVPSFYRALAAEFSIPYEGEILARVLTTPAQISSDLVHPNSAGYRALAVAVAAKLKESGAL